MARQSLNITDFFAADSAFATEFRRLLHRLKKLPDRQDLKAIMVTSAVLSEGKSTVCSFLAITAARKGMKTLLLDCDLRRPSLHKQFGLSREHGMIELLTEGLATKSVIKKTDLDKLDMITSGRVDAHPGDVFDPAAIGSIVSDLKFYYDFIVIDTPPVIPVSDPMLLASEVDGLLLVVKAGDTQREVVRRARDILNVNGAKILGLVMNDLKKALPYYYDYTHYGYEYSTSKGDRPGGQAPKLPGRTPDKGTSNTGVGTSTGKKQSLPR